MARPKTKQELLDLGRSNLYRLNSFIDSLPDSQQTATFPQGTLNRDIADVLAHLHHWHLLILGWHKVGMTGIKPEMPAPGFTWKTTPDLNRVIWEKYRHRGLRVVRAALADSFKEVRAIIESHSNEELFEKKRYKWTGTTSMGSYFTSATSSHYDWALKLIKKSTLA